MNVKGWVRNTLYRFLYSITGPGRGIRVILLYHSVGSDVPNSIPLDVFEHQMEIIANCFRVVRLRDLPNAIASNPTDANIATVTFDDGYLNNYECALPVLQRLGIQATFFVATGFVGRSFQTFAGDYPMMTEDQVRALAGLGHEIGAHTVNHPKLTRVPLDVARSEIRSSKCFLEDLLGDEVLSFAYPKGDCNVTLKRLVSDLGFKLAVSINEGLVDKKSDLYALPRVWISDQLNTSMFRARVSPATTWYVRLKDVANGAYATARFRR